MEKLIELDIYLFKLINQGLANPITDFLMPIITNGRYWLPVYIFIFIYLIFIYQRFKYNNSFSIKSYFDSFKYFQKGLIIALILAVGVSLSDQISATFIKEWVSRLRPCKTMEVNLLVKCGAGKSFPSSHASNNFLAASILSYFFSKFKNIFYFIAGLIALSRVFVGVHYPLDIFAGAILGLIIGYVIIKLARIIFRSYLD